MLIEGYVSALSVPETRPELFDPTFERDPKWRCPKMPELVGLLIRQRLRPNFQSLFLPSRRQSPAHFGLGRGINRTGVPRQARTPAAAYMWLFSTDSDLELLC
jgi:hypothetical protein